MKTQYYTSCGVQGERYTEGVIVSVSEPQETKLLGGTRYYRRVVVGGLTDAVEELYAFGYAPFEFPVTVGRSYRFNVYPSGNFTLIGKVFSYKGGRVWEEPTMKPASSTAQLVSP